MQPLASITRTVKVAAAGLDRVPERTPVLAFRERPAGRLPLARL
ncbi:hypothetical protein GCM10023213_45320 [Prosthecobacter algae]|uniref:Uncharacterized protein n=1 Tax=Prosthecobacter algae TaxID=1144682 RepID=A0ABP9PLN9_9BACT